jgi:Protein of unknown function (DUF4231)
MADKAAVVEPDSGYARLEHQIVWYDKKSMSAHHWYTLTKVAEVLCAAMVPFMAKVDVTVTALLGATITVLEGLQHLSHWSENWITYRSTCEALKHEKYSYLGGAGVYEGKPAEESKRILVSRVEALISTEHAKWISRQEYDTKRQDAKAGNN